MPLQLRQLRCCTAPVSSRGHRCAPQSQSGGGHLDSSNVVSVLCLLTLQGIRATSGTGCNASRLDAVVGPKTSAMTPPCILGRVGYRCATHTGRKPSALPGPSQQWRALPGHPAQSPLPPCTTVPHDVRQRATSARISAEQVKEVVTQLQHVPIPEELNPLKLALDAARTAVEKASKDREELEEKAQQLTSVAITAKEDLHVTRKELDEAVTGAEAAAVIRLNLSTEVDQLERATQEGSGLEGAVLNGGTVEFTDPEVPAEPSSEPSAASVELEAKRKRLEETAKKLEAFESMVAEREDKMSHAEASLLRAEERSAAAMLTAEGAVLDEMEAFTVAKEIQSAFSKALGDLAALNAVFDQSTATKSKEQADAERETMVTATARAQKAVKDSPLDLPQVDKPLASSNGLSASAAASRPSGTKTADLDRPSSAGVSTRLPQTQPQEPPPLGKMLAAGAAVVAFGIVLSLLLSGFDFSSIPRQVAQVSVKLQGLQDRLPLPEIPHGEHALVETIWILAASVVCVPVVCSIPGGSAVLGFLVAGALIGPHALGIINDVEGVRHLAELGVVFLLFNIGLELSLERLRSMQKYVFGMGTAQVAITLAAVAGVTMALAGASGPMAVVLGGGLALSSTAVAMQVLQDRGETGSRHGRAAFAILLLQDLAVVVLLMLIPLLAPSESGSAGFSKVARALGLAAVKAVTAIVGIIAGGRLIVRPAYSFIANIRNSDVFAATTLLIVLGTSVLTQLAGLSLALGAFLAGLLVAETEYAMQVESDIAPYKGLFMGLFFMTVGMEISAKLFLAKFKTILAGIIGLIVGKTAVMTAVGPLFGLSRVQAARAGLLLAAGGEFAFVAFGEAVQHKILQPQMVSELFLVVALSMAITPFLASLGQRLGKAFEKSDMSALQPTSGQVEELRDHVLILGFGRVGQIIGQLLSERLIPFVAIDVNTERVQAGKRLDLPVYFGDAGSAAVLHSVGAHRASCAVVTLDTPGANYRSVWTLKKHYPKVKVYTRAYDVDHGLSLEKVGATAVVPETLEPSLQLASAVLSEYNNDPDEVSASVSAFRKNHIAELQVLCRTSGSSLGYGFTSTIDDDDDP